MEITYLLTQVNHRVTQLLPTLHENRGYCKHLRYYVITERGTTKEEIFAENQ